jgi:hypothetical protein
VYSIIPDEYTIRNKSNLEAVKLGQLMLSKGLIRYLETNFLE